VIEIIEGKYKGQKAKAANQLLGKTDFDSFYLPGDKMIAAVLEDGNRIIDMYATDRLAQS